MVECYSVLLWDSRVCQSVKGYWRGNYPVMDGNTLSDQLVSQKVGAKSEKCFQKVAEIEWDFIGLLRALKDE
jgi:hypothetical protein